MRKLFAMLLVAAALQASVSLASAQAQGPGPQGGFTGAQATVPANGGNVQTARIRYGFRGQTGQAPALNSGQDDILDEGLFQFMPMFQLFGLSN